MIDLHRKTSYNEIIDLISGAIILKNILSVKIKEYRIKKGFTQEELGKLVGVTTQAVSKWERGGTPDTELLPNIADILGVSIDVLFGRSENNRINIEEMIIKELNALSDEERFTKAFSLCWAVEMGLTKMNSLKNKFTSDIIDTLNNEYGYEYYSKLLFDEGLVDARLSRNCRYFFLMPEPENGLKNYLNNIQELSETFALLSDMNILKILFFMYGRKNTAITVDLISKNTEIEEKKLNSLMKKLCQYNLADCTKVETEKGEIDSYTFRQECAMIPMLCFAKELRVKNIYDFVIAFNRNKPLL